MIPMACTLFECLSFPLLPRFNLVPRTALLVNFDHPLWSIGPAYFWTDSGMRRSGGLLGETASFRLEAAGTRGSAA